MQLLSTICFLSTLAIIGTTSARSISPALKLRDTTLPKPTRYITANDDNGGSYFFQGINTAVDVSYELGASGSTESLVYSNTRAPTQLTDNADITAFESTLQNPPEQLYRDDDGANVWFIDTPPGGESPFHRTISIDYVIQVSGQIILTTTDNDTRTLNPGDMVINRAVEHKWVNPSATEWSRLMAVVTHVQPVVTKNNGTLTDND